ncbi:ComEC/Rec2 family competence protein [Mesorhizobium sp. YR577]|uniref:ComEC/Rec2 family competence protein n=1 Tax=Mesorhizobium sp. YR577 TaxID=1884373 RepID=UPI0008EF3E1A|nr:ComEC/Rec2 family competence protein [Mesorhizobium sp. YR577]SFU14929.1 competence protein ComEC [Mesorhizobium sp. YR577]
MARETSTGEVSERAQFAYPLDAPLVSPPSRLPSAEPAPTPLAPWKSRPPLLPAAWRRKLQVVPSRARATRSFASAIVLELERGTPFLLVPVFLALGAIIYYGLEAEPDFLPMFGGSAVLSALLLLLPSHQQLLRFAAVGVLICVVGMGLAKIETWRAGTKIIGSEISTQLTGRVAGIDHMANGRVRLTIDVLATARPTLRYAPDRVRVSARKIPPGLAVGSEISGAVKLMPPSGPVRPDSYDFSFKSYFDRIGASGFFLRGPELVMAGEAPSVGDRFSIWVENARNLIADRIRSQIGGPEGEIAAALVVGIRAGIPEDINESMRRTGIYHIISISGLHMALVAGTVMGSLRAVFALFPGFSSRWPVKKYAAAAALVAIASYLFISGGEVAAQRSFIMLAIMLTALLFDRGALTMRNLAIAAIVVIVISPHEVIGPSFQMSFAATAALVGAYALWAERRSQRSKPFVPPGNASLIAGLTKRTIGSVGALAMTSIIAGLATTAFGAYHFQRVSPLSLLANLGVMPAVSILVMPFAVAGSLAMPLGLDGPFFYVMGKGLTAMIVISQWISDRSPIDAVGLVSGRSLVLLTVALVIATMASTWLRLLAVPFALAGMLLLADVRAPDILVSEDARLVAVPVDDENLAVNRARPNEFTIENWKRALLSEYLIKPVDTINDAGKKRSSRAGRRNSPTDASFDDSAEIEAADLASSDTAVSSGQSREKPVNSLAAGFDCHNGLCLATHRSGAIIAHAADWRSARRACDYASLIVIDDATAEDVCEDAVPLVVTKRELAKFGSAAVYLYGDISDRRAEIRFALTQPYRPWHTQRAFSREARGLPPYQRRESKPANNQLKKSRYSNSRSAKP